MTDAPPAREADQLPGVALPEQNLAPLLGHAAARAHLEAIVGGNRLPGAILLHGPKGIGKATLALGLAREILMRTGDEEPRRVVEQLLAGAHPNFYALRRQPRDAKGFYTVIRVDDIRELRERLRRTRGRSGYRIAVVDAIDDCNPSAANALLKTLEEPPPETLFLLVSHRPGALLPTIRSRCIGVALRPIADAEVEHVIAGQFPRTPAAAMAQAVGLAEGRPRRGFEALGLRPDGALPALRKWLEAPGATAPATHLAIADALAGGPEAAFARDIVIGWLASEAREAALGGPTARRRLASANELWDKAHALFADEDELNLDARQTLVAVFDAICRHARILSPVEPS